jgi:hypothetical protein
MKPLLLAVAIAACTVGRVAADPAEDALRAKAEACIRSAAPDVAAKAEGVEDAIQGVARLCNVEIARTINYEANARTLADWQGRSSSAQLVGVALDPLTGELKTPPGFKMEWDSSAANLRELKRITPQEELDAFAARAVIDARKPAKSQ